MQLLEALILGVVQGVTEVWPISSSAHLVLLPKMLGWQSELLNSLSFDVALHFGTLLAIALYFRDDMADMVRCWFQPIDSTVRRENRRLGVIVLLGTLPAAAAGFLWEHQAEDLFRSPNRVAWALILGGILMALVDRFAHQKGELSRFKRLNALWVGCFQALSIMPGVSRSGSCLTVLRAFGMGRPDAARLTFLLSLPLLMGASLLKARHFLGGLPDGDAACVLAGVASSAVAGYLTVSVFMRILRRGTLWGFGWYRLALGALVLALCYMGRL